MDCFLFKSLNENQKALAEGYIEEVFSAKKGDELYKNGHIGFLLEGTAAIKRCVEDKEITMRTLKSGDIFGSASLFGDWREDLSKTIAESRSKVGYISEENFKNLLSEIPQISINYIGYLTERIRFLNRKIDAFTAGNAESKIFESLQNMPSVDGVVTLEFGMAEFARRLKIGRTSLYRGLEVLENEGLIERDGHKFTLSQSI
ncbi:MAG: Crp/Fnr family transcriptional regulator [Clostridia bacterium]|nr:Crp/Fnr family transcriptional regulator [Clostridia bacterium]